MSSDVVDVVAVSKGDWSTSRVKSKSRRRGRRVLGLNYLDQREILPASAVRRFNHHKRVRFVDLAMNSL